MECGRKGRGGDEWDTAGALVGGMGDVRGIDELVGLMELQWEWGGVWASEKGLTVRRGSAKCRVSESYTGNERCRESAICAGNGRCMGNAWRQGRRNGRVSRDRPRTT